MSIEQIILLIPAVLFAVSFHEFSHGFVAYKLGDPTPKYQGRLTLNPLAHLDPIGTLMLVIFHFGWAKPVLINPYNFSNRRRAMMLVGMAGPLSNVFLAFVFAALLDILPGLFSWRTGLIVQRFILLNIAINLGLAAFNLIPVPPLDGSRILTGLLPPRYEGVLARMEAYGPVLLLILLFTGVARYIMAPIMGFLRFLVFGFF